MTDTNGRPQSCRRSRSNLKLKIILIIPPFQSVKKCTKELHVWFQWNLTGLRIIVHFPGKKNCHNPVVGALQIYFQKSFFIAQQTNQSQFFKIDDWLTPTNSKWESQRVTRTEVLWHGNSALDSLIDRTFLDPDSAVRKHFCYWERRSKLWNFQLAIYSILGDIIDLATNLVVIINSLMIFTQAWSCLCQLALLAGRAEISFQLMMGLTPDFCMGETF